MKQLDLKLIRLLTKPETYAEAEISCVVSRLIYLKQKMKG